MTRTKSYALPLVFFTAALSLSAATIDQSTITPGPRVRALGIDAYSFARMATATGVRLLLDGQPVAAVRLDSGPAGERRLLLRRPSEGSLEILWLARTSQIILTADEGTQTLNYDATAHRFNITPAAARFLSAHKDDIKLLSEVADDIQRPQKHLTVRPTLMTDPGICDWMDPSCDPWSDSGGGFSDPWPPSWSCTGPTVRGTAYFSGTRSAICQAATDDANWQCWNRYCVGCCQIGPCDAYCVLDDYLCVSAGVTGQACAAGY